MRVTPADLGKEYIIAARVIYGNYRGSMVGKLEKLSKDEEKAFFRLNDDSLVQRANESFGRAIQETKEAYDARNKTYQEQQEALKEFKAPLEEKVAIIESFLPPNVSLSLDYFSEHNMRDAKFEPSITIRAPISWLTRNAHKFRDE